MPKWKKPTIKHGKLTKYNYIVQYPENMVMGKNFDIGEFTYINCHFGFEIQDNVQVGSHCSIYSHDTIGDKKGKVVLRENCRIGSHSIIMPNTTIGKNSLVGAFSFVRENIPDNQFWFGQPAKFFSMINDRRTD